MIGTYDFTLDFAFGDPEGPLQAGVADTNGPSVEAPSLFAAVQDQLGLKLEERRAPFDTIVIDHVEKPDAN